MLVSDRTLSLLFRNYIGKTRADGRQLGHVLGDAVDRAPKDLLSSLSLLGEATE